jgi:hypothetical protein
MNFETMKRFLGDDAKYHLSKFGFVDGHLIATDGKILIRLPYGIKPDGIEYSEKYPNVKGVFELIAGRKEYDVPFKDTIAISTMIPKIRCENCEGHGKEILDCGECENRGKKSCLKNDCSMVSEIICRFCDGSGETFDDYIFDRKNVISGQYLSLMSILENVILYIAESNKAIRFTFDGGDGLVMPKEIKR